MTLTNSTCPKCGSDAFDTIKHSWRDGLPPHEDYYECSSCEHTWDDADIETSEGEQA